MVVEKEIDYKSVIEENLDDRDLWEFYFGKFKLGVAYCSVLRQDRNPSIALWQSNLNGKIKMKDFSTGDVYSPVDYVKALYNISYRETLVKICADFQLLNIKKDVSKVEKKEHNKIIEPRKDKIIQITPRQWEPRDMEYWNSYGVNHIETLKKFSVYPVEKLWINKKSIAIKPEELCYAYYFRHSNHLKIYFPFRKEYKWMGNCSNETDCQGYYPLEIKKNKPKLLIITKAMKEVLLFSERGIAAVAPHSEGARINPDFIRHLKKYSGSVRSLFDKDEAGRKGSEYLQKEFGILPIEFPDFMCEGKLVKDLTDAIKLCNREEVEEFINNLKVGYT